MNTEKIHCTLSLPAAEIGPKGMSNGGFACGTFAGLVGGTARATLAVKVPVARDLSVVVGDGVATVTLGESVVAEAEAVEPFVLEPPVRPTFVEAAEARRRHPLRGVRHPLSNGVVCGQVLRPRRCAPAA